MSDDPRVRRLALEGECVLVEMTSGAVYLLPLWSVSLIHVMDQPAVQPHQFPGGSRNPELDATAPKRAVVKRRRGRPPKRVSK